MPPEAALRRAHGVGMMTGVREVVMELKGPGGWVTIGSVAEVEPPGSISSDDRPRQVYLFGWHQGTVGVWRSGGGLDVETPAFREIVSNHLELLSDLAKPFQLSIRRGPTKAERRLRFTVR